MINDNVINVSIAGTKLNALIDTGASVNCSTKSVLESCPVSVQKGFKRAGSQCLLANGQSCAILGTVHMYVLIDGKRFYSTFSVFEKVSYPIILGLPFMRQHKASIQFGEDGRIHFSIVHPVYADSDVTFSPLTETLCIGKVRHEIYNCGQNGECTAARRGTPSGVLVANIAVTNHEGNMFQFDFLMPPVNLYTSRRVKESRTTFPGQTPLVYRRTKMKRNSLAKVLMCLVTNLM